MKKDNKGLIIFGIVAVFIIMLLVNTNTENSIYNYLKLDKGTNDGIKVTAKFYDINGNIISTQTASLFAAITIPVEAVNMQLDVITTNTGTVPINLVPRQVEYIWYQK